MSAYRIHDGQNGTVLAERLTSEKQAFSLLFQMRRETEHTAALRVQCYEPGSADEPGEWITIGGAP